MLKVVSSKGSFNLEPNQVTPWEEIFNSNQSFADLKSWNFNIPKTDHNHFLLADIVDADAPRQINASIDVTVLLFDHVWSVGPLYLIEEGKDHWQVSFAGAIGQAIKTIGDTALPDFNYPDPSIVDIYTEAENAKASPASYDYVFAPVDIPSLSDIEWYPPQMNAVVTTPDGDFDRFAEFFRAFEADDWSKDNSYAIGEYVRFNNLYYSALAATANGESPTTHPAKWQAENLGNIKKYVPIVPFLYVFDILGYISTDTGITFEGEIFEIDELKRMVFFNVTALNQLNDQELGTVLTNTQIFYGKHLPNITALELLKQLAVLFNQRIDYDITTNSLIFSRRDAILSSPVNQDLRDNVISQEILFNQKRTYNLSYPFVEKDVELTDGSFTETLEGIPGELNSEDIKPDFSTLPMRTGFFSVDKNFKQYSGQQALEFYWPGNHIRPVTSLNINDAPPKQFLIFRCDDHVVTNGPWLATYPELPFLGSGLQQNSVTCNDQYTLYWQGTGGLYETYFEKYLKSLSLAKVVRLRILLNAKGWQRDSLLQRQALRDHLYILETAKINVKVNSDRMIAELTAIML